MKMTKLTVSGSFKTKPASDDGRQPFSEIEIIVPYHPDSMHASSTEHTGYFVSCVRRLFPIIHKTNDKLKDFNYEGLITVSIDDFCEVEAENPCAGKDIKTMTWEELQYLSRTLMLREIPMPDADDIRAAREKAYETYMKVIKKKKVIKTPLDKVRRIEQLRLKYKTPDYEAEEIEDLIKKDIDENGFDMSINEQNLAMSYNFSKLPALIPVPAEVKKVGRPVGS